ncbi:MULTISPECIES: hypothetical protein [Pseudomonas]|jgi:hypothetical protein|uniref:Exported protein n=3 Tax=Pseudomonas fluorescens group TaxID=136843 RepID=C3K9U2_PSEFS|nr:MULTISPECIES: hypothetical protein [Pseudomonas]KJZ55831.1 hypothetical protein VC37_10330 [Pseudomonas marginalis]KJZ62656.1 hypothetical protein VC36_00090 [Pseudomonas marginalis]MBZ6458703.1 hypothetical protein [Pseudomonas fluorescens group sp.]MBZ6464721.1 hypothetical protein [Pseudomonas fluorescens group sp.]MBZ6468963.1 hypothetical protein [Pseudomonas fluorescens group sp.]
MKLSTLMLATLMTLTSAAAFAEGGSERSKAFYNDFAFMQQKTHGTAEQTAQADGKNMKKEAADKSTAEQQPNT